MKKKKSNYADVNWIHAPTANRVLSLFILDYSSYHIKEAPKFNSKSKEKMKHKLHSASFIPFFDVSLVHPLLSYMKSYIRHYNYEACQSNVRFS